MENKAFAVAKNEKIRNINDEYVNKKVRILGMVLPSKENGVLIIDDGTSTIKVRAEGSQDHAQQLVRVAGRVFLNKNQEAEIKADYIKDMSNLNRTLYSKVQELKEKLEKLGF